VTTFHKHREVEEFLAQKDYFERWISHLKKANLPPEEVRALEIDAHDAVARYLSVKANTLDFAFNSAVCSPRGIVSSWTSYLLFRHPQTRAIYLVGQGSAAIVTNWAELDDDTVQIACYRNTSRSIR
jgi:hypothetical protein